MEFHPIASLFPLIEGEAFDKLCADVQANGLLEPIWLYEGKILDGRNRYRACEAAVAPPKYRTYEGTDPVGHSISLNLHRRHLSVGQVAAVGIASLDFYRQEAAKRKAEGQKLGGEVGGRGMEIASEQVCAEAICAGGKAVVQAAKALGISEGTLQGALKVQKADPELFAEVKEGKRTVGGAVNELRKREGKEPYGQHKREPAADPRLVSADGTDVRSRQAISLRLGFDLNAVADAITHHYTRGECASLVDYINRKLRL